MLSVAAIENKEYLIDIAKDDYYLDGGEPPGQWYGKGAAALGLTGTVQPQAYHAMIDGFHPNGEKLVQNAGAESRIPGYDCTFSPPKSVSAIWSQAPESLRAQMQELHDRAVRRAIDWLEDQAVTRRGAQGTEHIPADYVIARFEHGTSRELDPQLHTHCVVFNVVQGADGRTSALCGHQLFQHKMTAGALYRAELARLLGQELNLQPREHRSGRHDLWDIKGVDDETVFALSKRRQQIEDYMAEHGLTSAAAAELANLSTREAKDEVPPRETLFAAWQNLDLNISIPELPRAAPKEHTAENIRELVQNALLKLDEGYSYFDPATLLKEIAAQAPFYNLSVDDCLNLTKTLQESDYVRYIGTEKGVQYYQTPTMQKMERALVRAADQTAERFSHPVNKRLVDTVLEEMAAQNKRLRSDQAEALKHILSGKGQVKMMTGYAGTGKSFVPKIAHKIWARQGYKLLGAAPSGKAAQNLENETEIPSQTIHSLLIQLDNGDVALDDKTILLVDEAAMTDTQIMYRLWRHAIPKGVKLVLLGDPRQLSPVGAGGVFQHLCDQLGAADLKEIIRQEDEAAKKAIRDLGDGEEGTVREALEYFDSVGQLHIAPEATAARAMLIDAWAKEGLAMPKQHMIYTGVRREAKILNEMAQAARKEAGLLGETPYILRYDDPVFGNRYMDTFYNGDRVLLTKNNKNLDVRNGDTGQILKISGNTIAIKLDSDGSVRFLSTEKYPHIQLGYAVTTYKAQGDTSHRAYAILTDSMNYREHGYTQLSRGKLTHIFTTESVAGENLDSLTQQLETSCAKMMGMDFQARMQGSAPSAA